MALACQGSPLSLRQQKEQRNGESDTEEERGRERTERPGTVAHHKVSALIGSNENNRSEKMMLMIATTIHIMYNVDSCRSGVRHTCRERERVTLIVCKGINNFLQL